MGIPAALSATNEQIEFLHARLTFLENFLCDRYPSLAIDIDGSIPQAEINSSGLAAGRKNAVIAEFTNQKAKVKKK